MRKNNLKLLTLDQLNELKSIYYFELDKLNKNILVCNTNYNRKTPHSINNHFTLNSKVRVIRVSKEAIKIWIELEQKYNLFDIQEVICILVFMLQEIDTTLVKKLLDKNILGRLV